MIELVPCWAAQGMRPNYKLVPDCMVPPLAHTRARRRGGRAPNRVYALVRKYQGTINTLGVGTSQIHAWNSSCGLSCNSSPMDSSSFALFNVYLCEYPSLVHLRGLLPRTARTSRHERYYHSTRPPAAEEGAGSAPPAAPALRKCALRQLTRHASQPPHSRASQPRHASPRQAPEPRWERLMTECWDADPAARPDFDAIAKRLQLLCLVKAPTQPARAPAPAPSPRAHAHAPSTRRAHARPSCRRSGR